MNRKEEMTMKKVVSFFLMFVMTVSFASSCSAQEEANMSENTEIILTINQPNMLVNGMEQAIEISCCMVLIAS